MIPTAPLVLIPVGSTEQHGPHLPLDTDTRVAVAVARGAAARHGGGAVVAPPVAYGSSGEHHGFAGTASIGTTVLTTLLVELVRSITLWAPRTVLVNGHGGNFAALTDAVRTLRADGHDTAWITCGVPGGDAHAGRTETSLLLHLAPELVRVDAAAPGATEPLRELLPRLSAAGVRALSPNGVLGDPTGASAGEGERILADLVDAVAAAITAGEVSPSGRLLTGGTP